MQTPPDKIERALLVAAVVLALAAIALTFLAPGFSLDSTLVYGRF
jgi:hypothetical protein